METAAAVIPLLFIAGILEGRFFSLPAEFVGPRLRFAVELFGALLSVVLALVLFAGEYVAVASLQRDAILTSDERFVGRAMLVGAAALLLPLFFTRGLELAPNRWARDDQVLFAGVIVAVGYAIGALAVARLS